MKPDLTGILIFAFLGGGILTFIGAIIKFFNSGDILNFYDEKIHDKNKVSKYVGNDIFYTGLGIICIAPISLLLTDKFYYSMMIIQCIITVAGLLLSFYHFFWICKKK